MEAENFPRKPRQSGSDWNPSNQNSIEVLKQSLQKDFDSQLEYAKKLYEDRIESITSYSRQFYESSQTDEVLHVMKESEISDQFVNQRMRELYEETMLKERDQTIENLHKELLELKAQITASEQEKQRLKSEEIKAKQLEREMNEARSKMAAMRIEFEEAVKRKDKEWQQKSEDVNNSRILSKKVEDQLFESEARIHRLTLNLEELNSYYEKEKNKTQLLENENGSLKKEIFELREQAFSRNRWDQGESNRQVQKISEEYERIRNYCQQLEAERDQILSDRGKMELIIQAEQKASHEVLDQLQKKYKTRAKHFKKKIIEQKNTIENLEQQLASYKKVSEEQRKDLEKKRGEVKDDLKKVKEEWEKRCHEILLESQRKEAELQNRHQMQLSSIQSQWQQAMEQRITELQQDIQTNRAKSIENDARILIEAKIAELEAEYVPKKKFEEVLKEKEKMIKELQQLKQLETTINAYKEESQNRLQENQAELEKLYKIKQILEEQLDTEKETKEELIMEIQKIKEYYEDEERSKKGVLQKLDAAFEKIGKLEGMCEEEKRKRVQIESEEEAMKRIVEDYKQRLQEQEEQLSTAQQRYENRIKQNTESLEDELEKERSKAKTLSRELQTLKDDLEYIQQEKAEVQQNFTTIKFQLDESKRNRFEESSKFEEESARHMETRSKLLQSEGRNKHLCSELEGYEKKVSDLKEALRSNETEMMKLKNKLYEYDNELSCTDNEKRLIQKQLGLAEAESAELKERCKNLLKGKLKVLRSDLKALKNFHNNEAQMLRKDINSSIQDLLFRFMEATNFMRKKMDTKVQEVSEEINRQWSQKMQEMEDSISKQSTMSIQQYQEKCAIQEKQLEAVRNAAQLLKKDQKNMIDELERMRKRNFELQENVNKLERDNSQLDSLLKKNSEAFDKLQVEVKQETSKLKQAGDIALDKTKRDLLTKHESELKQALKSLEEAKKDKNETERKFEEQIKTIENLRETELTQLKKRYQDLLDQAYSDLETERDQNLKLKQKFRQVEDETHYLEKEHLNSIQEFELKLTQLERQMKSELDKTASSTIQKASDVERLSQKLREAAKEIEARDEERQENLKEKEKIRAKLQELESKMELQGKNFQTQLSIKEKEIESLRNMLSKSYSESMDQVKRARELDRETQELTRQVRKGTPSRGSVFGQSPAESSRMTPDNLR
ncbi:unnamed protein product [Blepharisma stoltei]|uniref:Uncharacterized protein n=1 Tax=Blepharisma stoltei TaxID=1481888 RepID=A0AAU9J1G4_9CILI|nr:unnamed protein product [Blepharisma stoltei]